MNRPPDGPRQIRTVCFSGHRPERLPARSERGILSSLLYQEILNALHDGAQVFYSGMARGVDLYAAETVLGLRREHPGLRLICACPFEGYARSFPAPDSYRLQNILMLADKVVYVSGQASPEAYFIRNRYMVDHADRLIAVMLHPRSGTGQTLRYAERIGKEIRLVALPN